MANAKIAIIGECMIELSQHGSELSRRFGGDTLNTAVYLARQAANSPLDVYYVTALGTDTFSAEMLTAWQQEGVITSLTQRLDNKLPGLYFIETDPQGERTFYYWRNDAAARYWLESPASQQLCDQLADYSYLYLSGISLAILSDDSRERLLTLLKRCRSNGGQVIFDNNYRPRLWQSREQAQEAYRALLSCTNMAFLTLEDEDRLWGENPVHQVIARTHQWGVDEVVIKRGADPCIVATRDTEVEIPGVKLSAQQIIDTTAAGDSFSAGYLFVRLGGGNPIAAAQQGHRLASTVIQHRGAIIPRFAMPA